jgi:hypothetical protein
MKVEVQTWLSWRDKAIQEIKISGIELLAAPRLLTHGAPIRSQTLTRGNPAKQRFRLLSALNLKTEAGEKMFTPQFRPSICPGALTSTCH